jgi:hypothetical protein
VVNGAVALDAEPVVITLTAANVVVHRTNDATLAMSHGFIVSLCASVRVMT